MDALSLLVFIGVWVLFGYICKRMAENRGRDKTNGFVAGFFFGWMAVIYYAIVGDTDELKKKKWPNL